jgi:Dyp-type peroxidase family
MPIQVTSRSLRGATELTMIAPIKAGFVPTAETITYGTRLRRLLETFFVSRKLTVETDLNHVPAGGLEKLRTLRFVHWTIFDDDKRLLLAVSFDGPWESYIQGIVDRAGPLLDVIFCNCKDYTDYSTDKGFERFSQWVRRHQIPCDFIYAGEPGLTTDDVRYLKKFEELHAKTPPAEFERVAAQCKVGDPDITPGSDQKFLQTLAGLWRRRPEFAADEVDLAFFDKAARLVSLDLRPRSAPFLPPDAPENISDWAAALEKIPGPKKLNPPAEIELVDERTIQGNILTGYKAQVYGCLAFVQFEDPVKGAMFLEDLLPKITVEGDGSDPRDTKINVALTFPGLRNLGLSAHVLDQFPKEFQEGLARRAAMLGIVGQNHPAFWASTLPLRNWPHDDADAGRILLDTIDAIVVLQTGEEIVGADIADNPCATEHPLHPALAELTKMPGIRLLGVQAMRRNVDKQASHIKNHFGFEDGISQPVPSIKGRKADWPGDRVPVGEILLGYPDHRGETWPFKPERDRDVDLFRNGSFLVMAKIAQDVAAFQEYEETLRKAHTNAEADHFLASLVGRHKNGKPLATGDSGKGLNAFDFEADRSGDRCPFHAHIRRANPRFPPNDAGHPTPRIMRRGFSYGGPASAERGIIFMAYNASIGNQYEVIQGWINGGNSTGGLSHRSDVLAGLNTPVEGPSKRAIVCIEGTEARRFPGPDKPLVKMHWGLYLFSPSTKALMGIVDLAKRSASEPATGPGELALRVGRSSGAGLSVSAMGMAAPETAQLIPIGEKEMERLNALSPLESRFEWKRLLETRDKMELARAVWAAIRARGGMYRTPMGVLVGGAEGVRTVLSREDYFSVRTYWGRMSASLGETMLGMDAVPKATEKLAKTMQDERYERTVPHGRYQREAHAPNKYMAKISFGAALAAARTATDAFVRDLADKCGYQGETGKLVFIDVAELAAAVLGTLANDWFGLPPTMIRTADASEKNAKHGRCPIDFAIASQFIFRPDPGEIKSALAQKHGKFLREAALEFAKSPDNGPFLEKLRQNDYGNSARQGAEPTEAPLARAWIAAVNGFVAPTFPTLCNVMSRWIAERELWRLQQWLRTASDADGPPDALLSGQPALEALEMTPLWRAFKSAFLKEPVPDLLYREAVANVEVRTTRMDGRPGEAIRIDAGEQVIVSLASAATDEDKLDLLFGGTRAEGSPLHHACPGQQAALGVMLGIAVGLLQQHELRERPTRLQLQVEPRRPVESPAGYFVAPTGSSSPVPVSPAVKVVSSPDGSDRVEGSLDLGQSALHPQVAKPSERTS